MKAAPTVIQWIGTIVVTSLVSVLLANPGGQPESARRPARKAVDQAARLWLLLWGEPTELLDDPTAEWGVEPEDRLRWRHPGWQEPSAGPLDSPGDHVRIIGLGTD